MEINVRRRLPSIILFVFASTRTASAVLGQPSPTYDQSAAQRQTQQLQTQQALAPSDSQPQQGNLLVQPIVRQPATAPGAEQTGVPTANSGLQGGAGSLGQPVAQPNSAQQFSQPGGPPFQLTTVEQQFVTQILQMWETKSKAINTFTSDFERLEYDAVFGPGTETPIIISQGRLSYAKPDKGSFKIEAISRWKPNDPQNPAAGGEHAPQKNEVGEHWVCDGKAVYEYDYQKKQLVVTTIPKEMRGQAIVDGPLPFLFGAEAKKLAARYWIRSIQGAPQMIWLEAYPRWASDAQNYQRVEIMLDRKTMQPTALQVHLPGGQQRHVYKFNEPTINSKLEALFGGIFDKPKVPWGWERVVNDEGGGPQAANPNVEEIQR